MGRTTDVVAVRAGIAAAATDELVGCAVPFPAEVADVNFCRTDGERINSSACNELEVAVLSSGGEKVKSTAANLLSSDGAVCFALVLFELLVFTDIASFFGTGNN